MRHLGDITKISGYYAPIVDCIIGGSPCQDLSVANGNRSGLDGERSGLYMEQIRIVKEMRKRDELNGRSGVDVRPRYMVWENVPGAFSSNKGEDFRIVLEEIAKVCDKDAVIPMPDKEKWTSCGCILGDGWSVAWRVLDAQFWGVPQRRRRIALVADFGGQSAPEILFVSKSVSGNIEPGEPKRKRTATDAEGGIGTDDREQECVKAFEWHGQDLRVKEIENGISPTLSATMGMGGASMNCPVLIGRPLYCFEPGIASREGGHIYEGVSGTLRSNAGDNQMATAYSIENHPADSRVNIDGSGKVQTLTSRMGTGGGNVPMVMQCFSKSRRAKSSTDFETWKESETANTLNGFDIGDVRTNEVVVGNAGRELFCVADHPTPKIDDKGISFTQSARDYKNPQCVVCKATHRYIVRRLTPLECERLQGYPDGWTDIGEWTDSKGKTKQSSDAARYKALGNSIALPPWKWVLKRLCACYERDATMASLFDGIGGFPYLWEQLNGKGSCLWASEIEEFPMAVTKVRIGE